MKKTISLLLCFSVCLCFLCSLDIKAADAKTIDASQTTSSNYRIPYSSFNKIYLNDDKFTKAPKYIVLTVKNTFGDPVADCKTIFIEKNYDKISDRYVTKNFGDIYQPITEGENGRWEQIPFEFDGAQLRSVSEQKLTGVIYLENNLKSKYEFTPGTYRLVVEYSDGSKGYANFVIYA